jgi:choline transport protein
MSDDKAVEIGALPIAYPAVAENPAKNDDAEQLPVQVNTSLTAASRLERYISLKPMVAFGLTLQSSWESIAISLGPSLINGGPVTLTYGIIIAAIGSSAIALSLGEMASIDPTVGAQYRWTARHCPRRLSPKFWGLLQGTDNLYSSPGTRC